LEFLLGTLLIIFLAVEAAEQFLLTLNMQHLSKHGAEVPPGFEEYVDAETLAKMRDYTVAHGRLDRLETLLSVSITLLFLFGGILNWFNNLIGSQGWSPVISGIVFFMALVYADTLIKVPFPCTALFPWKNVLVLPPRPWDSGYRTFSSHWLSIPCSWGRCFTAYSG